MFIQCSAARALWLALDLAGTMQDISLNNVICLVECIKKLQRLNNAGVLVRRLVCGL